MQISNIINSKVHFGKTPVAKCNVYIKKPFEIVNATIYKMDPKLPNDVKNMESSKNVPRPMYRDFKSAYYNRSDQKEFYIMTSDKSGEVISCAETSHRYRDIPDDFEGKTTLIEDISENIKFSNTLKPLIAYISDRADKRFDKSVYVAFRPDEFDSLSKVRFSVNEMGDSFIQSKHFKSLINCVKQKSAYQFIE